MRAVYATWGIIPFEAKPRAPNIRKFVTMIPLFFVRLRQIVSRARMAWPAVLPVAGLTASYTSLAAPGISLEQAWMAAEQRSESIADQEEQVAQAGERYRQAIGSVLPSINAVASRTRQDKSAGIAYPREQHTTKLTLTQPLFRGFREYEGISQLRDLKEAQAETSEAAKKALRSDVAQAFFAILSNEKDLANLSAELRACEQRVKDLRDRIRIGRSRETEVLSVESSAVALQAQQAQIRGVLAANRELFTFLTGLAPDSTLNDTENPRTPTGPVQSWLSKIDERPEIKANVLRDEAATTVVRMAREAHLPTIDLNGNYYLDRSGPQNDVKWDATLAVTLPVFAGGTTVSKTREAASQKAQAGLALARARRAAEQEIRTLHAAVNADAEQVTLLSKALEISSRNVERLKKEYQTGLANNLEVLQAITNQAETARALDKARYVHKFDSVKLLLASQSSNESRNPAVKGN